MFSSPSVFGLVTNVSNGPMKTYLKSQYHMDPPDSGHFIGSFSPTVLTRCNGDHRSGYSTAHSSTTIGICSYRPGGGPGPSPSGSGGGGWPSTIARTTVSNATLCSAITSSIGCCSPCASAASAQTGHHTCWHLPG